MIDPVWFFLGLAFLLSISGGLSLGSSVIMFDYKLDKEYAYICSECGQRIPKKHYHIREECERTQNWSKLGELCKPDHSIYFGAEKYMKEPPYLDEITYDHLPRSEKNDKN